MFSESTYARGSGKRGIHINGVKHTIWSNYDIDYKDWLEDLESDYPNITEEEKYELVDEINNSYLDDERINLDIELGNEIIILADLGLWDGRHSGYKLIKSGNIKDCLYSDCDYADWYVDTDGDMKCNAYHHDGCNHYVYRTWKAKTSEKQKREFLNNVYNGTATSEDAARYTKSIGKVVSKVYGWK